ncbi:MAG: 2-hydroxyacyl-CoA dehydratase family protein [Coriobacteriia bacterium]|nr:2-hydroxyacyl-CoA dehydratase family protein [Coriobacteriia bacterium]
MRQEELIARFAEVANDPKGYVLDWKKRTGRKAFGVMACTFGPEELIYASGALPVGTWGGNVAPNEAFQYFPTFYCSLLTGTLQLGMQGAYDGVIDAFVCGTGCDGLQDMMEDWKLAVPSIPVIPCVYPQRRDLEICKQYMIDELRIAGAKMTEITGQKVTDLLLQKAMYVYNEHNAVMREFSAVAGDHLDIVTPLVRRNVFKSARFMDKAEHTELVREFTELLKSLPAHEFDGVRVVTTGIIIDSEDMLKAMETNRIGVVGDSVVAETKLYDTDIVNGIDLYYQLAQQWCDRKGCSILEDYRKQRGPMIVEQAKACKADAVLVNSLKFCEPEAYDYPIIRRVFAEAGLPELHIDIENTYSMNEQAATRMQAFVEMLGK